jgi:hypothetical protein
VRFPGCDGAILEVTGEQRPIALELLEEWRLKRAFAFRNSVARRSQEYFPRRRRMRVRISGSDSSGQMNPPHSNSFLSCQSSRSSSAGS